jgi:hypothetical protein
MMAVDLAAANVPLPSATARDVLALTTAQVRAARGLLPRQASRRNGPTIDAEPVQLLAAALHAVHALRGCIGASRHLSPRSLVCR